MNRAQRRHNSKSHGDTHAMAVSAHMVMEGYRRQLNEAAEEVRKGYQRQAADYEADYWQRCLSCGILAFQEVIGSASKTEKFAGRFAEMVEQYRDIPIGELVAMVERATGIELEVRD